MCECNVACLWRCIPTSQCPAICYKKFYIDPLDSIEISTVICGNDNHNIKQLRISATSPLSITLTCSSSGSSSNRNQNVVTQYTFEGSSLTLPTTISSCSIDVPNSMVITNIATIGNNITISKEIKDPAPDDRLALGFIIAVAIPVTLLCIYGIMRAVLVVYSYLKEKCQNYHICSGIGSVILSVKKKYFHIDSNEEKEEQMK